MEHTLADEMEAWSIDFIRAFLLIDRVAALLDEPHPALVPANILIDDRDAVRLVDDAAPAAPYRAPEANIDEKSNVYSLAVILRELLGRRTELTRDILEAALRPDPAERANLGHWRIWLTTTGWQHHAAGAWHPSVALQPTERALVDALPDDGGRDVYADWLEQHGFADRARFLRSGEPAPLADARWRARVAETRIENCFHADCARRWEALAPTPQVNVRDCTRCARQVHYCASLASVQNEGRRGVPIVADASLARRDVTNMLMTMHVPSYVPLPANPPLPRSYSQGAPGAGVLTRLFGLFRRR